MDLEFLMLGHSFLLRHPILKLQSYHTVQAIPRECTGNRVSARDRAQGRIPAVVFAQILLDKNPSSRSLSRKQLLTSERKQIQCILKSVDLPFFCSTTFPLQIRAGSGSSVLLEPGNVLPVKEIFFIIIILKIHRDAETGKILNLVFVWADEGTELKVDVPVVFRGQEDCPGLKKGGALNMIRTSLRFLCPAEYIPQKIEVDVSNLDVGDRIFMRDIEIHTSLKLLSKNENMPVCKIVPTTLKNAEPAIEEELKHDAVESGNELIAQLVRHRGAQISNSTRRPTQQLKMTDSSSSIADFDSSYYVDPMCAEIIVVRHGETEWNADGRIQQGHLDVELNEVGKQQAASVADRLSKEPKISAVYSSDLKRALVTAEIIAASCGGLEVCLLKQNFHRLHRYFTWFFYIEMYPPRSRAYRSNSKDYFLLVNKYTLSG
ncbi:Ribosomal protein L25/Gln-tRNA synthetase anti-codon-binding domain [Tripterygium wilfordii]|uniref:Ribosomal protein L25/Gln-tRNA synthetase anti-codon-binding domain n=1 Tax=Tripterygium wilfordii TaxID=458696 RepID=A0A7J7E306_TRIWF|nr:Ribosomal protein L25/Gln-tRNA synthetase anti-codon-binding domain [Tripterygium wilfordii]